VYLFVRNNFKDCNFLCHKELGVYWGRRTSCTAGGFFADIHNSTSYQKLYALTTATEWGWIQ